MNSDHPEEILTIQQRAEALRKSYLGDGVYADFTKFGDLVLTTENGVSVTNRIVLEPEVLKSLLKYLAQLIEALKKLPPDEEVYVDAAAASDGAKINP